VGTAFSYQIVASGSPTSYSATGLPAGLIVNATSGTISGTPTAAATSAVTLRATNAAGSSTKALTITVAAAPVVTAPVISSAATVSGTVGTAFSYQIVTSGSPTSYSATGLPAGLTVNATSGVISGTPTVAATSTVTLAATNAGGSATKVLTITVVAAPVVVAGTYNYPEVLQKSLYFFDAQKSGKLPVDFRVPWRGDSALTDGSDVGLDLTGGFYDAGDHVKFGLPMTSAMSLLAWGGIEYGSAYDKTGQKAALLDVVRWGTDWLMKAHPSDNVLYGQVGNGSLDHSYWGPSETMTMARPAYAITAAKPGSDLAGEAAAAMASASMLFRSTDPVYADKCLAHARTLFKFADQYRGKYSDSITDAATYYNSWSGYYDELAWAAAWMYRATGEAAYLTKAETIYSQNIAGLPLKWTHNWDDKSYGTTVLLAQLTGKAVYKTAAEKWLNYWTVGENGSRVAYTPGGLAWLDQWGSLRYSANTSLLALIYADRVGDVGTRYRDFARNQIDYMLGKNPAARSYVVGFGVNPPINPHHRGAHGSWNGSMSTPTNSRHILYGALVGGPSAATDTSYTDDRSDYISNEVALDYNAAFTGAVARLAQDSTALPAANFPPVSEFGSVSDEFFVEAAINQQGTGFTEIRALMNNRSAFPATGSIGFSFRYYVDLTELFAAGYDQTAVVVSANYVQNGTVNPVLQVYNAAAKIYYVDVSFAGTNIQPGTGTSYWREAQFRMALKTGIPATAWNPANDPSYQGLGSGNANILKTDRISVYESGMLLNGLVETLYSSSTASTGGTTTGGATGTTTNSPGTGTTTNTTVTNSPSTGGSTTTTNSGTTAGTTTNATTTNTTVVGYDKMPTVEQRKIVGYYPNWGIYQKGFPVTKIRGDRMNVINYAFLIPLDRTMPTAWDKTVSTYRGWKYSNYAAYMQQPAGTTLTAGVGLFDEYADAGANSAGEALTMSPAYTTNSNFGQLQALKKQYPKLKTMVSIGGWTLSAPLYSISRDAQKRTDFAKSAVYVIVKYGFDGIDIDWEYPGGGGLDGSGVASTSDGANYNLLLKAIRDEMNRQTAIDGKKYYLSIAGPGGDQNIANFDPKAVSQVADWINIMTYDFHGGWDSYTGINAPMVNIDPSAGRANWSVQGATQTYLNGLNGKGGVPAAQLVLGVPFYGRGWDGVQAGPNGDGLGQAGYEATSPGLGETEFPYNSLFSSGALTYSNGVYAGAGGYKRYWNATAQVPYLDSATAKRFITYDDSESMQVKANYANQLGLGGLMFWELSEDVTSGTTSLLDSIYDRVHLP
jgi:GH18 family chitinase